MMAGFKTVVPTRGRRRCITLSVTALNLGAEVAAQLPKAPSYDLGHDGRRRFVLVPADGGSGVVKFGPECKSGALRCTSMPIVRFLREKLGAPDKRSVTLSYKMVEGVLMFGILDGEVRV